MHRLTILHMFNLSILFHVCVLYCDACCVILIEIGGDELALRIPFM